jgi:hypothetical protein
VVQLAQPAKVRYRSRRRSAATSNWRG